MTTPEYLKLTADEYVDAFKTLFAMAEKADRMRKMYFDNTDIDLWLGGIITNAERAIIPLAKEFVQEYCRDREEAEEEDHDEVLE